MLVLTIDAALSVCAVSLVRNGALVAGRTAPSGRGQSTRLAPMTDSVLRQAGQSALTLHAIAVTVGPGSFTGLRAALALAHGIGAAGIPVVGVTIAEALAPQAGPQPGRTLWTVIDSRRDHVFLHDGATWRSTAIATIAKPDHKVALAGDAADSVAAHLRAIGADAIATDARLPEGQHIAEAALARLAGVLPPLPAQPLYIDPPEAKLPAGGLRPAPLPAA